MRSGKKSGIGPEIALYSKKSAYAPFVYPTVIVMLVLTIIPTLFLYAVSMTNYELGYGLDQLKFVWFDNYIRLFSGADKVFWYSIGISLMFMLLATAIELLLGYSVAALINREFKLKGLVFACLIIPITITPSIAAQIWKLMLDTERGVFNYLLSFLGVKIPWLSSGYAYWSVLLMDIWQWTPYMALIIYAGMRSLPAEPYESALIDGASRFQLFRFITLPLLRPLLLLSVLLRGIDALKLFDIPYVLTLGGPGNQTELMSMHVFRLGFNQTFWIGRASAMAIVLLICITLISRILTSQMRKGRE